MGLLFIICSSILSSSPVILIEIKFNLSQSENSAEKSNFQTLRIHYYHLLQITVRRLFPELQAIHCKHPNNADKLQSKMFP